MVTLWHVSNSELPDQTSHTPADLLTMFSRPDSAMDNWKLLPSVTTHEVLPIAMLSSVMTSSILIHHWSIPNPNRPLRISALLPFPRD